MSLPNIQNPFASDLPEVGVQTSYTKPTAPTLDPPIIPLPYAPSGGYNAPFGANLSLALTGLRNVQNANTNGNIITINNQELTAISNTITLFTAMVGNAQTSPFPFTQAQLQDMFVSLRAVNNSKASGGYITLTDLANNNVNITDANTGFFPEGAQTVTVNDQYAVAELPGSGSFYWSNNANLGDWSVLNVADMEAYSDQPIAIDQFSGLVVAFGLQSIQFYQDAGTLENLAYTSPILGSTQNYGLAAIYSRAPFMNSIAFLGRNRTGQAHILWFPPGNYIPQIISSPDIGAIINSFNVIDDAIAYSYDNNGHEFYRITFPTANRSFDYDGTTKVWYEVMSGTMSDHGRHLTTFGITFNGTILAADAQTGNVYILDPSNATDNGFLVRREFTTRHVNVGGDRFKIPQLWIEVTSGPASGTINIAPTQAINISSITEAHNEDAGYMSAPFATVFGSVAEGAVNNTVIFGATIGALLAGTVNDSTPSFLSVYMLGNQPQNLFSTVSGIDANGVVFSLSTASANSYVPNVLSSGYTWWSWTGLPNPIFSSVSNSSATWTFTQQVATQNQSEIALYWSVDNGNTWKGPRVKSMGKLSEFSKRVMWRRFGVNRDIIFKFVVTDPVPFSIVRGLAVLKPAKGK